LGSATEAFLKLFSGGRDKRLEIRKDKLKKKLATLNHEQSIADLERQIEEATKKLKEKHGFKA